MEIKIIKKPNRKITQSVLYFQFRFMGWSDEDLKDQDDRYGSIPFGYAICYHDKKIVSVINLHKRIIVHNNQKILIGGIGGVCTHTEYRRQGLASKLLNASLKALKEEKCDIAFLCTDIKNLGKLYANTGFVPLKRDYQTTGKSNKRYFNSGGMIAPIRSKRLFTTILNEKEIFNLQGQDW